MTKFDERYGTVIEGIKLIRPQTHSDERGFFREVLRIGDIEQFGQWSHSMMVTGTIKAWHIHQKQTDYWYVPVGVVKAVVCDLSELRKISGALLKLNEGTVHYWELPVPKTQEFLLGDIHTPQVLVIPPGVAHGLKVLQGPAHLFYITSREYDPSDEGRIPFDSLGYDWFKQDIK